ncbi:uncharacterized protein LOC106064575 [Biomphalaria glabrata]|uniref:Uncharacterized protein LOC106064575 n=1 Tax=Biomphalaria glabrata TaxID=6526 RepID=A0A9U8E9L0_BIOGL|nr:uncharacterized protein LOC106064575 [Biomphalaria glabrata]
MGSAVVKPLSKKRGTTKSSDPGESSRLGNQNVNIAKGNQEANVGIGEGTKSIQVDPIADPVTNVCKSVSEKPYQDAGSQKPAVSSPSGEKVVPCYDSDEEPYPIQKANYSGSGTNESVDQKAQNAGEKDRGDSKGKVTFEPHLPLAERSHPPLTSDHQRFRRFSSLFRTGSGVSCFRKSGRSLKSVDTGEADQKVKTGSTGASPEPEAIIEVELQPANSDEKDVCCDARTPSPQYDKLEDLDIINPSPKSVDINLNQKSVDINLSQKPVDINLSQKSVDINLSPKSVDHPAEGQQETQSIVPCSQEIQEDSSEDIDMLVIGKEMKLCGYEQDEHRPPEIDETTDTPTEIEDPAFDDRSFEIEAYDELEENKDSLEIKEHTDPVLDTETHTNRYRSAPLSTSSSKESNGEQSCDSSPLKCLNRTQDFKDVRYSNQASASGSECCVNPSVHSVNAYEDLADCCGGSGGVVIKESSPAPSPCDTAQPLNDIVHTEMPPEDSEVLNCSGVYEEKEFSLLNGSVPANPTLKNTWSEEMQDFRNRLNAALEENFMNGVNSGYSLKTLERFSECDLRNMSPIKEEAIGCESLCTCEQPQRETPRSSSAKSTRANQDLNEEGKPLHSQIFYSSSRNSLHLSDSRLKQSTPPPCPVTTCKSNVSTVSQPELRCNPISYSRSPTALQFVSSKEKLNPSDQRSEPETPVHQITETASNISVTVGQSRSIRSLTKQDLMATHSNSSKSLTAHDPASVKSKSSFINIEQNTETEPLHLRSRPKSEKLYAPMNLHSNASKVRPISANVLYPLASHIPQQTGAMKLPPITSMCSMTARPVSAKQPTSKSEVFLPASQPDIGKKFAPQSRPSSGKQFAPQSRPSSGKQFAPQSRPSSGKQCAPKSQPSSGKQSTSQSRPVSGSPRQHSATYMQRPGSDRCSPSQCSDGPTCDRADLKVRLSPICVRSDRHGCGEQWTSQPVYEVEVNKCESATDLRVTSPTVGSHQPGFRESGDGPHISAPSPKKACEDPCSSSEALTCSAQSASTTRASSSRHALATCSVEQLTGGPDANKPSWSDGPPKEQAASPVKEVYPQALTLSADQIGSIRQQLYEEGLKPAERDGGVAFFIPMTVDGLQPQANGVTISDRLTRSRRSSLSYEERLILANINRQAQLHKKKEFALKDIQNVRGAASNAEIDRSKHEEEIDADLDSSL